MFSISLTLLEKLCIAIVIGGIVGLEREHTKKQTLLGVRTFALIALLGMFLTELSRDYFFIASAIGLVGIFALTISFYFFRATNFKHSIGLTTIIMLPMTYIFGMLISLNYLIETIASTVIVTYVLIEKGEVHHLVEKISRREIVDFLLFAVIAFVIYPLVPTEGFDFFGQLINLQSFVQTVILISLISFISHIIARVIKHNAVLYASFFGGLISSLATVMLFARDRKVNLDALRLSFTSSSAGSILRDALLLLLLSVPLFRSNLFLFAIPILGFLLLTQYFSKGISLGHFKFIYNEPISILFVIRFALVLFVITTVTTAVFDVSQNTLLYLELLIAGAVNSASVIASVAFLFANGNLPQETATNGIFFGLLGSALSKLVVAGNKTGTEHLKNISILVVLSLILLALGHAASWYFPI